MLALICASILIFVLEKFKPPKVYLLTIYFSIIFDI